MESDKMKIDYKKLRRVNPTAARLAVIEYLSANRRNIALAARVFGVNRPVIYDILRKHQTGDLSDRSRVPKHQPQNHRSKHFISTPLPYSRFHHDASRGGPAFAPPAK